MVAITVRTNTVALDQARKDWDKKLKRFHRKVGRTVSDTVEFIVDTKLRLAGVAVRLGGVPGPTPGSPPSPVLHRDTGALAGSVMVSWPKRRTQRDASFVVEIGMEANMVYAPTHEFGDRTRNIPERPFMQPAAQQLALAIHAVLGDLLSE